MSDGTVHFTVTRRDGDEAKAQCSICHEWMPIGEIMVHLRVEHELDLEIEEWPDGRPVVFDQTLEPKDFS